MAPAQKGTSVKIKVLLADDHPIVRSGIRNELALHADIELVGEAMNGDEALRLCKLLKPDVLLLDINMPGLKAVKVVCSLRQEPKPPRVLVLTAYGGLENALEMLRAGARGYLLKDEDPSTITEGIRAVAQGRTWLSAAIAANIISQVVTEGRTVTEDVLSPRELEVLRLLACGYSNTQITETLTIAEGTVKNHITNLLSKLGVHSRTEAAAWAWQRGLVQEK